MIDSIYIIAEINDSSFAEDLKRWDVNEVVCTAGYGKDIIIQSMLNHGISNMLDELLTFNDHNEFYTIDLKIPKFKTLRGKKFDDLLPLLRVHNILLIGIKTTYLDEDGIEIIDGEIIKRKLKKDKLLRQYMLNPYLEEEKKRPVDDDDQLIVLCTSNSVITDFASAIN